LRDSGQRYHVKQSATVIMEPNGAVRAIVGGRDYGDSQFNRATEAQRQPGSSFKPFVYTTALMTGKFTPDTIVEDAPVCVGNWCPHNFGGTYAGHLPLWLALTKSLNTVAVRLSIAIGGGNQKVGRTAVVQTAHKMGITTPLPDTPSLVIGADSVTVIDMASAYSTFANGGHRAPPFAALEVRNARDTVLYRHYPEADALPQIIPGHIIEQMVGMMTHVVEEGTARAAQIEGVHLAGKTGTTNESRDAWFVGYSGNFVEAIWFGNDDNSPMEGMTGGSLPARTWHEIMAYAHNGVELKPLPGDDTTLAPSVVNIPQGGKDGVKTGAAGAPMENFSTLSKGATAILRDIEALSKTVKDKDAAQGVRQDGVVHL
jgi:penicillin-binding protein 1A